MLSTTNATASRSTRVERFETIVIGAGQAGLAVGHELDARDSDFAILDGASQLGDSWRTRWDSLRLFTPAAYSGLPGMPFPAPPEHLPDKDEVADYLTRYAERFDLPVRLETRVRSLRYRDDHFVLETNRHTFEASSVAIATGGFQRPKTPRVAAQLSPAIHQVHSSQYRNAFALPDGPVLVVGAGNSGAQIALELARVRKVWLAGRDTGYLPRRLLGRDLFRWLWPAITRASSDTIIGRRLRERTGRGGDARIGIPDEALADAGVTRVGKVVDAKGGLPVCGGVVIDPKVVVWCTGFEPDYSWVDLPVLGDDGQPQHRRGVATHVPGLYFIGLRFQHRLSSSLIGGVGADAAYIAQHIARRCLEVVV